MPAQGTKAPVDAPAAAGGRARCPALPPHARFGTAQINTGSAALNFPERARVASGRRGGGGAVVSVAAAARERRRPRHGAPRRRTVGGTPPRCRCRFGRARSAAVAEVDAGPPDTPPPPGARFGSGQLSFADAEHPLRRLRASLPGSASVAAPGAVALPGGMALREEGRGLRVTLDADVLFDFDRAELRPEAGPRLQRLMQEVSARIPRPAFRVEGHTDWIGSDAYNLRLSARRAESVRNWLVRAGGVPRSAVSTAGYGESRPVAPNSTPDGRDDPEGRQRNRRVELVVTPR